MVIWRELDKWFARRDAKLTPIDGMPQMPTQVVTYTLDDGTAVRFEVEPVGGFTPASADQVVGPMQEAVEPALSAAQVVLDKVRKMRPDEVEVKFAIKVSGTMNWLVAKAATEGNFEITLRWQPSSAATQNAGEENH